jgi:hypothetical protein
MGSDAKRHALLARFCPSACFRNRHNTRPGRVAFKFGLGRLGSRPAGRAGSAEDSPRLLAGAEGRWLPGEECQCGKIRVISCRGRPQCQCRGRRLRTRLVGPATTVRARAVPALTMTPGPQSELGASQRAEPEGRKAADSSSGRAESRRGGRAAGRGLHRLDDRYNLDGHNSQCAAASEPGVRVTVGPGARGAATSCRLLRFKLYHSVSTRRAKRYHSVPG